MALSGLSDTTTLAPGLVPNLSRTSRVLCVVAASGLDLFLFSIRWTPHAIGRGGGGHLSYPGYQSPITNISCLLPPLHVSAGILLNNLNLLADFS